jgi:hypothetical protein
MEWMRSNTGQRSSTNGTTISLVTRRWNGTDPSIVGQLGELLSRHHGVHLNLPTSRWGARAVAHSGKYFWRCIQQQSKAQLGSVCEIGLVYLPVFLHANCLRETPPILGCNQSSHWTYTRPGLPRIHSHSTIIRINVCQET